MGTPFWRTVRISTRVQERTNPKKIKHCPNWRALPKLSSIAKIVEHWPDLSGIFPNCKMVFVFVRIWVSGDEGAGPSGAGWGLFVGWGRRGCRALFIWWGPALFIRCRPALFIMAHTCSRFVAQKARIHLALVDYIRVDCIFEASVM